ncbi:Rossmann-like and DUF2520 domain-containing protein [Chryseosolibacter indicus]|nr:Rossmann-like and DUF2520 domain-containing protein [Chryseosolibacter indicus]
MNVSIIGSGNLAWHLAPALDNTDFAVKEVYSHNPKNAEALAERLYEGQVKTSLDFSLSKSKIFVICVSDDVIPEIAQQIVLPDDAILIHTSGSQPLSLLGYSPTENIGVFYPLQTFTKSKKVDFSDIPILIESENDFTEKALMTMGKAISKKVLKISSESRKAVHVAAVFASNFTNHMLTLSHEIMRESNLDFDLLKPLIAETVNKGLSIGPERSQTGPAKRGDLEILDKHMEFLKDKEEVAEMYRIISQDIIDRYAPEED